MSTMSTAAAAALPAATAGHAEDKGAGDPDELVFFCRNRKKSVYISRKALDSYNETVRWLRQGTRVPQTVKYTTPEDFGEYEISLAEEARLTAEREVMARRAMDNPLNSGLKQGQPLPRGEKTCLSRS